MLFISNISPGNSVTFFLNFYSVIPKSSKSAAITFVTSVGNSPKISSDPVKCIVTRSLYHRLREFTCYISSIKAVWENFQIYTFFQLLPFYCLLSLQAHEFLNCRRIPKWGKNSPKLSATMCLV